jgi:hypothetical protein
MSLFAVVIALNSKGQNTQAIQLKWVDNYQVGKPLGVSWGVPLPRGTVKKLQSFTLTNDEGRAMPVQTWPTAIGLMAPLNGWD